MNKTILITGASSGIGKEAAKRFAAESWNVIATMRSPGQEEELATLPNVMVSRLEVQDVPSIEATIEAGIARFGAIDAIMNNAGYGQNGLFEATTPEQIASQFGVNVFGVMNVTRAILPHFRSRNQGMFLNISSGAGKFTLPLLSLYSASKFALEGFSEALSYEMAAIGVTVKIIEPGGTVTNFSKTAGDNFAMDANLKEYDGFLAASSKLFASLMEYGLATVQEVVDVIYNAATDGTDTLRYSIGNADFTQRLANRNTLPDQEYVNSVKQGYMKFMSVIE